MAELLGFSQITANSLDAVGDRDFMAESIAILAVLGMHLSRLAGELVLWSGPEFGFIEMDEAYCTGSSYLPQKKNPDPAELVRGKTGRLYGNLTAILTIVKGLPLAYNRDLQEDKEPLFDSVDTVTDCLAVMRGVIETFRVNTEEISRSLTGEFLAAADLAEYLVDKGVPFQEAHQTVGRLSRTLLKKTGEEVELSDLKKFSPAFEEDALELFNPEKSIRRKTTAGSTAPGKVKRQLARWEKKLK